MANNPSDFVGSFLPTTNIWDVDQIYSMDVKGPEFKELLVRMYQNLNDMALSINIRDAGFYNTSQFVNGQLLFPNPVLTTGQTSSFRQIMRLVINFGALPNTGTKSVAHGIIVTDDTTFTRIYGAASDTTGHNYIPLPFASPTLANNISLSVDATNVTIVTGSNRSNFNITYVVLEYVQT